MSLSSRCLEQILQQCLLTDGKSQLFWPMQEQSDLTRVHPGMFPSPTYSRTFPDRYHKILAACYRDYRNYVAASFSPLTAADSSSNRVRQVQRPQRRQQRSKRRSCVLQELTIINSAKFGPWDRRKLACTSTSLITILGTSLNTQGRE
eukprot:SAG31_NODE_3840_length_3824_cov_3.657817_2_plen_148_part_00